MQALRSSKVIILSFMIFIIAASAKVMIYQHQYRDFSLFDMVSVNEAAYQFLTAVIYISVIGVLQWLFQWFYYNAKD